MFDCTICNRQFKSLTGAKLHMKVKHGSKVMHHMQSALSLKVGRSGDFLFVE